MAAKAHQDLESVFQRLKPEQREVVLKDSLYLFAKEKIDKVDNNKFSLEDFPFLKPLYTDRSKVIVAEKSAQLGLTIHGVLESFHKVYGGLRWIYFFPTAKLVQKFVQDRYDELIENNPKLKELIRDTDSVNMKKIGTSGGVIHFAGMGSATKEGGKFDVISIPADGVTFDEHEKMKPVTVEQALERITASPFQFERYLSTPGLPGYGVDAKFQTSDQKYWNMKCPHCNHWNVVDDIEDVDDKGKLLHFPAVIEQGFLACIKCRRQLDPRRGEMVAKYPDRTAASGYHFSRLYFPRANYEKMINKWREATTPKLIKNFYNDQLGFPYVDLSAVMASSELLKLCGSNPMATQSAGCFMGADIGGSSKGIHVTIIKPGPPMFELVWCGIIREPDANDENAIAWIQNQFKTLIVNFGVKRFCLDAMPETRMSKSIVMRHKTRGWITWYSDSQEGSYQWNPDERSVKVNRSESLDNSHYILKNKYLRLPQRNQMIETFAAHCEHLVREVEEDPDTGKKKAVWKKIGPEDFRHSFNYAVIAAGFEGKPALTPTAPVVTLSPDPFYKPNTRGYVGQKVEW